LEHGRFLPALGSGFGLRQMDACTNNVAPIDRYGFQKPTLTHMVENLNAQTMSMLKKFQPTVSHHQTISGLHCIPWSMKCYKSDEATKWLDFKSFINSHQKPNGLVRPYIPPAMAEILQLLYL